MARFCNMKTNHRFAPWDLPPYCFVTPYEERFLVLQSLVLCGYEIHGNAIFPRDIFRTTNLPPSGYVFLILREIILHGIFDATIRGNRTYLFPISSAWNKINPDIKTVWCGSKIKSWAWRNAPLICIMDCVLESHLENWYLQECKDLYLRKKQGSRRYSREFILTVQTQEENNA